MTLHALNLVWYSNRDVALVKMLKIHYMYVELILCGDTRGNSHVHLII